MFFNPGATSSQRQGIAGMHKSRLGSLVIDCRADDLTDSAGFWAAALGYPPHPDQPDPTYVALTAPDRELRLLLQRVDHDSRVHLDIETDDIAAETARLEGLGARRIGAVKSWVVMEAPSGHRFCVVPPQRPDFAENATEWS